MPFSKVLCVNVSVVSCPVCVVAVLSMCKFCASPVVCMLCSDFLSGSRRVDRFEFL